MNYRRVLQGRTYLYIICCFLFTCFSCTFSDDESSNNYLTVNGVDYDLTYGIIDDDGTNYSITGRYYDLCFKSSASDYPSDYIRFTVLSTSTTRLQEDTYSYNNNGVGELWDVEIGTDLLYDNSMNAISGQRLSGDYYVSSGSVIISRHGDYYEFTIDIEMVINNKSYTIQGYYTGLLHQESL
jgi:hypothetical protein